MSHYVIDANLVYKPIQEPINDITKVTQCQPGLKNSSVLYCASREAWVNRLGEMIQLVTEIAWRRQDSYAAGCMMPLRVEYMYERLAQDDPMQGWYVRDNETGIMQGFLTWTYYRHYVPLFLVDQSRSKNCSALEFNNLPRKGDPWDGVVFPHVAELTLLAGVGCGKELLNLFVTHLATQTDVKFIIVNATDQALSYYKLNSFIHSNTFARFSKSLEIPRFGNVDDGGYSQFIIIWTALLKLHSACTREALLSKVISAVTQEAINGRLTSLKQMANLLHAKARDLPEKLQAKLTEALNPLLINPEREAPIDMGSAKFLQAAKADNEVAVYTHWQPFERAMPECHEPSNLLTLKVSSFPTFPTASLQIGKDPAPAYYPLADIPASDIYSKVVAPDPPFERCSSKYYYVMEYLPYLHWAHLIPMEQAGRFPESKRRRFMLPQEGSIRELEVSSQRLRVVEAVEMRNSPDVEQEEWDIVEEPDILPNENTTNERPSRRMPRKVDRDPIRPRVKPRAKQNPRQRRESRRGRRSRSRTRDASSESDVRAAPRRILKKESQMKESDRIHSDEESRDIDFYASDDIDPPSLLVAGRVPCTPEKKEAVLQSLFDKAVGWTPPDIQEGKRNRASREVDLWYDLHIKPHEQHQAVQNSTAQQVPPRPAPPRPAPQRPAIQPTPRPVIPPQQPPR